MRYLLISILFLPVIALAHGTVTTRQQVVGNYKIEFEYNTQGTIYAGDYYIYNIYLLNNADDQPIDFDSVFIRFEKKGSTAIAASTLAESSTIKGYASMSMIIPDPGTYTAAISYYKDNKSILQETSFDFEVQSKPGGGAPSKILLSVIFFIIGIVVGGGGILWLKSKGKRA